MGCGGRVLGIYGIALGAEFFTADFARDGVEAFSVVILCVGALVFPRSGREWSFSV